MIQRSYAKINLVLNVLGKHNEKLHELDSVMLPLELHDSLQITILKDNRDSFVNFVDYSLGGFDFNLATFAIDRLCEQKGITQHFRILINKVIPISAGLGGGSSNAAATLIGVSHLMKLPIDMDELTKLGFSIGSDVPFFLHNVPARVRGAGQEVEPIFVKNDYYVLIVKPLIGLSTKKVFAESDKFELNTYNVDRVVDALRIGDDEMLAESIGNSLEQPSISLLPEIQTVKDRLRDLGCKIVLMSGSGSSIFAMSTNKAVLKKAYKALEKEYEVYLTRVLKEGSHR